MPPMTHDKTVIPDSLPRITHHFVPWLSDDSPIRCHGQIVMLRCNFANGWHVLCIGELQIATFAAGKKWGREIHSADKS